MQAQLSPVPLRPPSQVMRLSRMGSFHQTRLSFMRILLRRLQSEKWRVEQRMFDIDKLGVGTALYTAVGPERSYTLVAFGHDLPPEMRSDRVIAEAWDATFTLFDGIPDQGDIDRLAQNVPFQEAGRIVGSELVLARANRSVRLFEHVISELSEGRQPDALKVDEVGYLMRTTAVYGSGKFGAADRDTYAARPELTAPFQAEMLAVWLIRTFVMDLVEHMARCRNSDAAVLDPALRRQFGIGNSTGLGMAPYLVNHPVLLNNWMTAREAALARVRGVDQASDDQIGSFLSFVKRATINVQNWRSAHELQIAKLADLRADFEKLGTYLDTFEFGQRPWDTLYRWSEDALSVEGQEALIALMLELYPQLTDDLAPTMSADENTGWQIDGAMRLDALRSPVEEIYDWANAVDWTSQPAQARAWYVSAEKLEPRLGERFEEPIAEYEQPLSPARDAIALLRDLDDWCGDDSVAAFLLRHPEHRHTVRRVQRLNQHPYGEIRDNTIAHDMLPIDMLRCKLAFFGAGHFDPRSDRWVRINMFKGAPFPHELQGFRDDWPYPESP